MSGPRLFAHACSFTFAFDAISGQYFERVCGAVVRELRFVPALEFGGRPLAAATVLREELPQIQVTDRREMYLERHPAIYSTGGVVDRADEIRSLSSTIT